MVPAFCRVASSPYPAYKTCEPVGPRKRSAAGHRHCARIFAGWRCAYPAYKIAGPCKQRAAGHDLS